jgi:diadenosine tetraphosphate (Ap4A) HIT family hydrolase
MIDDKQAKVIKEKLLEQLDKFPEDQRESMKKQVESLDNKQLEEFLKANNLIAQEGTQPNCLFCSINAGAIPSYKVYEDDKDFIILEINPLSTGNVLVASKEHKALTEVPKHTNELAKEFAEKLKKIFPDAIEIKEESKEITGHGVIELIPIYGNETSRAKASEEELQKVQKMIVDFKESKAEKKVEQTEDKVESEPEDKKEGKAEEPEKEKLPQLKKRVP